MKTVRAIFSPEAEEVYNNLNEKASSSIKLIFPC